MTLQWLDGAFSVLRLDAPVCPEGIFSLTRLPNEISLVCETRYAPDAPKREDGFVAFGVVGALDFSLVGILARLTGALAGAKVPVFALSTYDTDYLLVKKERASEAERALTEAGYRFTSPA